ncbi:ABC transporter substrate-binding protein [Mesorhizobium sp. BR1-1-16]|uniref:ABC transporter substrate-binding protein n=1 Tax=Mesorhizobium sp. BR1-1-16 TaxID=2876653 RepID=UPI001CCB929D|nr:ABC transporter substrate-binding protein [Mesorhizobium sp. BR1-1-16]MBZ9938460.1 ABC transporter substrate-binding protein [Mesorhizobium sp. BR1-1-16]
MTLSRRTFLGAAGAAGIAAGFGFSFEANAQDAGAITMALAVRGLNGLSPQQPGTVGADNWVMFQIYEGLVKVPDGNYANRPEDFLPSLAESWESTSDALTWTYHLRKGVQFHKGYGEMTADDVLFCYNRQLDPKTVTVNKLYFKNIASIEAPDAYTVVIKLTQPDPMFNGTVVSTLSAGIMSRKAFEEKGAGFNFDPIGTGPFQLESYDDAQGAMLVAFPDFHGEKAAAERLTFTFIADTTARTLAFASGQIDMIDGVRSPGWIESMQQRSADTKFDVTSPGSFNFLHLNLTRKPLDDIRVRQAIRYAIDNEQIAQAYGAVAKPMVGLIASQFEGSVTKDELPADLKYNYDPEKAKALLAEAGLGGGVTIPCYVSQREDYQTIMLIVQEQLRTVGITLDMPVIEHNTFHADNRNDKNAMPLNSTSYPPLPLNIFAQQVSGPAAVKADGTGGGNYSHYGVVIPGVDQLLDQARQEPSFEARTAIFKQIETKILSDLPCLGIITLGYVVARNPRVDLGYEVVSGGAAWALWRARRAS